jgi:hypothetical protein
MPQQQRQKKTGMPANAASILRSIDFILSMNFSFLPPGRMLSLREAPSMTVS